MNIVVPIKLVPDLVEELEIDDGGAALDTTWLRLVLNEVDEHAVEQALLLKARTGAAVTVMSLDVEGVDDELFAAAAKGADRLIKLTGSSVTYGVNNHALARMLAPVLRDLEPELVLTGVQAHDDLDGCLGPLLAEEMGMPYLGYVSGLEPDDGKYLARKEYPGGLVAEMEVAPPAVIGIQTAEEPPRYVAVARLRQVMKATTIEEQPAAPLDASGGPVVASMYEPETGDRATMITGSDEEVAERILQLLSESGATVGGGVQ
jgi:electron transfer flavoprotein beta subunit